MKNEKLLKISLSLSLIGIFILALILEYQEIPLFEINKITKDELDMKVKIRGELKSLKETQGLYLLSVEDNSSKISVVVFKNDELNLTKYSTIEVEGKVLQYQNRFEIIADKIILLK